MEAISKCRVRNLTVALALLIGSPVAQAETTLSEYELKAVFLFQFSQFVSWPKQSEAKSTEPFIIGLLGQDPFGPTLDKIVQGEKVAGRSIEIRRLRSGDEVLSCHILFVAPDAIQEFAKRRLSRLPILTVGESTGFRDRGGMILLTLENKRVHIRFNAAALQEAGLVVSSKLLRVADKMEEGP